jgi:tRNA pseudouridine38-40 synthase
MDRRSCTPGRFFVSTGASTYPHAVPRYRLTIAYDGTDFCGWQKQEPLAPEHGGVELPEDKVDRNLQAGSPDRVALRTVQAIVERAVREVVREPIMLQGASRTDAGVHAKAQCGAFSTVGDASDGRGWPAERGTDPLVRAVNSRLPDDVLVLDAGLVHDGFDPIADATSKGYSYTIVSSPHRPLWDRRTVFHTWQPLDASRMAQAASYFVGEHDFAAFAAAGHGRLSTVRTVHACAVQAETIDTHGVFETQRIRIDISGNGFLYNMVRIIGGTLHEIGRGKIEPDAVPQIIAGLERRMAGPTLPPEGLCLEWIRYGDEAIG